MKTLRNLILLAIIAFNSCTINPGFNLQKLRVEYTETPIGIDVEQPRFSWQMNLNLSKRGYSQSAYQLVVVDPAGETVWDSKKVTDPASLNIQYSGKKLQPATIYNWTITVWNQNDEKTEASSWFETGLLNPDPELSAWEGAKWIGGADEDMVFYSPYLSVFKFSYSILLNEESQTSKAGFIFGANDSRLMDKNKNTLNVENNKNESYIKFELDISGLRNSEGGSAKFNIYRIGYHPDDNHATPFISYPISRKLINKENMYDAHEIFAEASCGIFNIFIDGSDGEHKINKTSALNLNPVGWGDFAISFPMLAEIGFALDANQKARFSNIVIRNYRYPSNILFSENMDESSYTGIFSEYIDKENSGIKIDNESYALNGGENGLVLIADPTRNSMPMLRSEFNPARKKISKARLYITSRGVYEVYINGDRIGNDYFNPGLTQYNKTHMYQVYDVGNNIQKGKNAIAARLGEGWWSGHITYNGENWNYFGDRQSLLAKLVISYADGTSETITTNPESWKYFNDGPVVYSSFFQGEVYDATKEFAVEGWSSGSYDDSSWKNAVEVPLEGAVYLDKIDDLKTAFDPIFNYDSMQLTGQIGENAGIVKELTAISVDEVRPGVFVYDMGQNMVGFPELNIEDGEPGKKITIRYAEVKYPDLPEYSGNVGMIMLENIRTALAQDIYILRGGIETVQPHFTFHGYRFLEITGIEKALAIEAVKGIVISSVKELASSYETSNPKVNKLWENICWSTRGNFLSIPTDCPQRNERMGWGGDISVFARTASYVSDVSQFLNRHVLNMRDIQRRDGRFTDIAPLGGGFGGILWGSAGITVAWESFQQYGDRKMISDHYDAMKNYLSYLGTRINPVSGVINEGPLGDWLSPEVNKNDNSLIWEAYYIFDLDLMAKMATVLGKTEDALEFRGKHAQRLSFFNNKYVDKNSGKTINYGYFRLSGQERDKIKKDPGDPPDEIDTQISYAVPLAFGVFNAENQAKAAVHLANTVKRKNMDDQGSMHPEYSLMTGFIGTAWINKALNDFGYNDISYKLLQQTSYPSWLYPVDQGATTIWERLNSYTIEDGFGGNNSMNSFNHYAFGAVGAWMVNYSLGIERDENEPGFKHFILQPNPDPSGKMTYAKGHYDSMYGRIESDWRVEKNNLYYNASIPANSSATLHLPVLSAQDITEGGKKIEDAEGVRFIEYKKGKAIFELKSGKYSFTTPIFK